MPRKPVVVLNACCSATIHQISWYDRQLAKAQRKDQVGQCVSLECGHTVERDGGGSALPRGIGNWSPTSLQQRRFKHAQCFWPLWAERPPLARSSRSRRNAWSSMFAVQALPVHRWLRIGRSFHPAALRFLV